MKLKTCYLYLCAKMPQLAQTTRVQIQLEDEVQIILNCPFIFYFIQLCFLWYHPGYKYFNIGRHDIIPPYLTHSLCWRYWDSSALIWLSVEEKLDFTLFNQCLPTYQWIPPHDPTVRSMFLKPITNYPHHSVRVILLYILLQTQRLMSSSKGYTAIKWLAFCSPRLTNMNILNPLY